MSSFVNALIRSRLVLLPGVIGLILLALPWSRQLEFDQSIEAMYAPDDPYLQDYLQSKALFGGDEFVIVAYSDPDLFSSQGMRRVRRLSDRLSEVPGVEAESTQDLADALAPRDVSFLMRMLLRTRERELRELFRGVLVGDDDQTTAIVLRLAPEDSSPAPRSKTIEGVRAIAQTHDFPTYIVGEPVQVHDMFQYVEEDGRKFLWWSLGLLALVMMVLFRSLRWMVLPLLVVVAAIFWTRALLVLGGMKLSMVSSMINSLVMIVGIATVTHVTVHYRKHRGGSNRVASLRRTLMDLLPAVFWACTTTAVGFAALFSSEIVPVRSFATMMTLAILLVLVAAVATLPGGILLGRISPDPRHAPAEERLVGFLGRMTNWVEHHPWRVAAAAVLLVLFTATGLFRLDVETDFSRNFRQASPIVQSLDFVETRLGGAGTWEVNFSAPRELNEDYLDRVRRLAQRLREIDDGGNGRPELTKVVSLTDGLDLVPRRGLFAAFTLDQRFRLLHELQPEFREGLYNAEEGHMRIVLRARERQPSERKLQLIAEVEQTAREEFPEARATGLFVLLAHIVASLLDDQIISFSLAAAGIGGMMIVAFRSLWIALISLVPNVFPIVLVVGTMGWIGLPINIGTAMIASISVGLTIDGSIHYIAGYQRGRRRGLDVSEALNETQQGVGRAIVFANLALVVGFLVLTLSHFIPLIHFGVLISVAMLAGVIANLLLLPLLLQATARRGG